MDFKDKIDVVFDGAENIKEWMINQPKKRCGLIEGHDNYWEGKVEAIKKVLDEIPVSSLVNNFPKFHKF